MGRVIRAGMVTIKKVPVQGVLFAALLGGTTVSLAAEPLALQAIMKELERNMQLAADGIAHEDWDLVARTAPLIADHPQPSLTEKMRILAFAGANVAKFKAYDRETHDQALAVRNAARARDRQGVLLAFHTLQASCVDCHSEFLKPFREHFYGDKRTAQ